MRQRMHSNHGPLLRPLTRDMHDQYTRGELMNMLRAEAFAPAGRMDVSLLQETLRALDERPDDEAAPHQALVWADVQTRLHTWEQALPRRRRLRLALALVAVLLLGACATLLPWQTLVERVLHIEQVEESLTVSEWSPAHQQAVLAALQQAGYDLSSLPDTTGMSDEEQSQVLGAWLSEALDGPLASAHGNLLLQINGFLDDWSLQDKAWYADLLMAYGLADPGDFISIIPPDRPVVDLTQAMNLTAQRLEAAYAGTDAETSLLHPCVFYGYSLLEEGSLTDPEPGSIGWRIRYRNTNNELWFECFIPDMEDTQALVWYRRPTNGELAYQAAQNDERALTRQQAFAALEAERGWFITWTLEQKAEFYPEFYALPEDGELREEEAIALARSALPQKTSTQAPYAYCYFVTDASCGRAYFIHFFSDAEGTQLVASVTVAADGSSVETASSEGNG